jgi:predicted small lipoprotein YifL
MIASRRTVLAALAAGALTGCGRPGGLASGGQAASAASATSAAPAAAARSRAPGTVPRAVPPTAPVLTRAQVVARYGHLRPHTWGFRDLG